MDLNSRQEVQPMSLEATIARSLVFLSLVYMTFTVTCFAVCVFLSSVSWLVSYAPAPQEGLWASVLACAVSWTVVSVVIFLVVWLPRRIWRVGTFIALKVLEHASL